MPTLCVSRKYGESVIIGEGENEVKVTVVDVLPGGKVRLSFTAAKSVPIDREELRAEKLEAARKRAEGQS